MSVPGERSGSDSCIAKLLLEKERESKRTQLVERLNTAVITASILARARSTNVAVEGETDAVEQMVV